MGKKPEKEQVEAAAPPDAEWLHRTDFCQARVDLGKNDHAIVLAVTRDIRLKVEEVRAFALELIPTDEKLDLTTPQAWRQMVEQGLSAERVEKFIGLLDDVLTRSIASWSLADMAKAYGWNVEPPKPSDVKGPAERTVLFDCLPIPALARIIYGIGWLSGNL